MLLPFLLDASLRPNRLSTFGGSERTMHWNLMGEGSSGKTRVGYVWLEFVRDDGGPTWFTCGARLQATVHTTGVTVDYFTTGARIDRPGGLAPVNEAGQPLTRAAPRPPTLRPRPRRLRDATPKGVGPSETSAPGRSSVLRRRSRGARTGRGGCDRVEPQRGRAPGRRCRSWVRGR